MQYITLKQGVDVVTWKNGIDSEILVGLETSMV